MTLIAFEGLDQSGKETQSRHLRARLEQDGHKVRSVSFPDYETPIGQEIRRALAGEREYGADVMQLLYIANRLEYKPRLELWLTAGDIVICDRYRASSLAYGEAQQVDPGWLDDVQRPLPEATVTVLLDISPEAAAARKAAGRDRFERDLALLGRVRDSYRRLARARNWVLVNAELPKDDVSAAVEQAVLARLARRSGRARAARPRP
jgi:dTMP kinase